MTTHNFNSPVQVQAKRRRFDRYFLDLDRGSLLFDGNEIALRPKTFAVLHYLVDNCGRLVSKDELFASVWPNLAVTDDVLVQSIGELRRALGDDGARLIKTIPRRGYRFEADVSAAAKDHRPSPGPAPIADRPPNETGSSALIGEARPPRATYPLPRLALLALAAAFTVAVALWGVTAWRATIISGSGDQVA